jgi:uncharacterized paraquat-inducible protein A
MVPDEVEREMSFHCPNCDNSLQITGPRAKDGQMIDCPTCNTKLTFKSNWKYFSAPTYVTMFLAYGLMFRYEGARLQIFLAGLLIVCIFAFLALRSERFVNAVPRE